MSLVAPFLGHGVHTPLNAFSKRMRSSWPSLYTFIFPLDLHELRGNCLGQG